MDRCKMGIVGDMGGALWVVVWGEGVVLWGDGGRYLETTRENTWRG